MSIPPVFKSLGVSPTYNTNVLCCPRRHRCARWNGWGLLLSLREREWNCNLWVYSGKATTELFGKLSCPERVSSLIWCVLEKAGIHSGRVERVEKAESSTVAYDQGPPTSVTISQRKRLFFVSLSVRADASQIALNIWKKMVRDHTALLQFLVRSTVRLSIFSNWTKKWHISGSNNKRFRWTAPNQSPVLVRQLFEKDGFDNNRKEHPTNRESWFVMTILSADYCFYTLWLRSKRNRQACQSVFVTKTPLMNTSWLSETTFYSKLFKGSESLHAFIHKSEQSCNIATYRPEAWPCRHESSLITENGHSLPGLQHRLDRLKVYNI
jgi:hypothetical protein